MATFVQILIAAVLSLFGMNQDSGGKTADQKRAVIESTFPTHYFPLPAEKNEYQKWEYVTIEKTNCDYDS